MVVLKRTWCIFSILLILLAFSVLGEETCDYEVNACSSAAEEWHAAESAQMNIFYAGIGQSLFVEEMDIPERYPAALWRFSQGTTTEDDAGNELLQLAFEYTDKVTPLERVYLAWIYATEKEDGLSAENTQAIESLVSLAPGNDEVYSFLTSVEEHLLEGTDAGLKAMLTDKGMNGWSAEVNPGQLAQVVTGLSAIFNASSNPALRRLAEMNLDLIFARFAALNAGGAFGGLRAGDTAASGAFDPLKSPWFGWSRLLFGEPLGLTSHIEPSLLVSGYCAHDAVRAIYDMRMHPRAELDPVTYTIGETFNDRDGRALTIVNRDFVLGGSVDTPTAFTAEEGFVTRGSLRFVNNPRQFLLLSNRVTDSESIASPDAVADDGGRVGVVSNSGTPGLLFGKIGGASCKEPHLFISNFGDINQGTNDILVIEYTGVKSYYIIFQFLGGMTIADTYDRYRPLSRLIPSFYADESGHNRGRVAFPNDPSKEGVFAMEIVPTDAAWLDEDNLQEVLGDDMTGDPLTNIGLAARKLSELSISGNDVIYKDTFKNTHHLNSLSGDYALRQVTFGEDDLIYENGGTWSIDAELNGAGRLLTLDFTTDEKVGSPLSTMTCPGSGESASDPVGSEISDVATSRLAYLSASMLKDLSGDYVLDCGPVESVLPNAIVNTAPAVIEGACVLDTGDKKSVGLLFDPTQEGGYAAVLQNLNIYFPLNLENLDSAICDEVVPDDDEPLSFVHCPPDSGSTINLPGSSYGSVSIWANPEASALVISSDANPFTDGWFDGVSDFFDGVFGGYATEPGENPATAGAFDAGYFFSLGEKHVRASLFEGHAEIFYENLASSIEPLLQRYGSNAVHRAGGTLQRISVDTLSFGNWRILTSSLRIAAGGDPKNFPVSCGNGIIEDGEECDDHNTASDDGCSATCKNEIPPEPTCVDADHDGVNATSTEDCGPNDCFDLAPENVHNIWYDQEEVNCSQVSMDDCDAPPGSLCPQCVNELLSDVCGDGVDNDCDGTPDNNGCHQGGDDAGTPEEFQCPDVSIDLTYECDCEQNCADDRVTCYSTCTVEPDPATCPTAASTYTCLNGDDPSSCDSGERIACRDECQNDCTTTFNDCMGDCIDTCAEPEQTYLSDYGLNCEYTEIKQNKVAMPGIMHVHESYIKNPDPWGNYQSGDRFLNIGLHSHDSPNTGCYMRGNWYLWNHNNAGSKDPDWTMDYALKKVIALPSHQFFFWGDNDLDVETANGVSMYIQAQQPSPSKSYDEWHLKVTVSSTASQSALSNFLTCWHGGTSADWDAFKSDGQLDRDLVNTWAQENIATIGDKMAVPCEPKIPEQPDPTCNDGMRNQGEERIDCGGPNCDPCAASSCDFVCFYEPPCDQGCGDDEICNDECAENPACPVDPNCAGSSCTACEDDADCPDDDADIDYYCNAASSCCASSVTHDDCINGCPPGEGCKFGVCVPYYE